MIGSLLPPSAPPLAHALETAGRRLSELPVRHADLWRPDSCPVALLPWLAWAFSVDDWDDGWAEAVKRRVIANAYRVHRLKGTPAGVELALATLGFRSDLTEWFEEGGVRHHARRFLVDRQEGERLDADRACRARI